jgi:hypothetical protein
MKNTELLKEIKLLRKAVEELKNRPPIVITQPCYHPYHVCPPCYQPHYPSLPVNPYPWIMPYTSPWTVTCGGSNTSSFNSPVTVIGTTYTAKIN